MGTFLIVVFIGKSIAELVQQNSLQDRIYIFHKLAQQRYCHTGFWKISCNPGYLMRVSRSGQEADHVF